MEVGRRSSGVTVNDSNDPIQPERGGFPDDFRECQKSQRYEKISAPVSGRTHAHDPAPNT